MVCLGLEPGQHGNPLSYVGTPFPNLFDGWTDPYQSPMLWSTLNK